MAFDQHAKNEAPLALARVGQARACACPGRNHEASNSAGIGIVEEAAAGMNP